MEASNLKFSGMDGMDRARKASEQIRFHPLENVNSKKAGVDSKVSILLVVSGYHKIQTSKFPPAFAMQIFQRTESSRGLSMYYFSAKIPVVRHFYRTKFLHYSFGSSLLW